LKNEKERKEKKEKESKKRMFSKVHQVGSTTNAL